MMMITDMMVDRVKEAVEKITDANESAEIPDMGGYYVTTAGNELPENAKKVAELGINGTLYLIYTVIGDDV